MSPSFRYVVAVPSNAPPELSLPEPPEPPSTDSLPPDGVTEKIRYLQ